MRLSRFRTIMQLTSSVLSNGYIGSFVDKAVNTNFYKGLCVPYLNCYACPSALFSCPIGTLQHFMAIQAIPYMLLGFLGLVGLCVGRMACGWICPFGFLQDLLHRVPSPKYQMPRRLLLLKYLFLLIFVIILPFLTGETWFSKICPAGTMTAGIPWVLWNPVNPVTGLPVLPADPGLMFIMALAILFGFLICFMLFKRPFCKTVCPLGAIFALFNRYSLVQLEINKNCDACTLCETTCPMDLNVPLEINSGECIFCLECTQCGYVKLVSPFTGWNIGKKKHETKTV
ncbi:ferredoxin-type protein NapH [Desulfovibrionales bacterium]